MGEFLWSLQVDLGWYVGFWLLAVAGASASSVTIEREKDTWVSLTATPLTGWEILRGKVMGAIWNQRGFAAVLVFLWLLAPDHRRGAPAGRPGLDRHGRPADLARRDGGRLLLAPRHEHVEGDGLGTHGSRRTSTATRLLLYLWFLGRVHWDSSFPLLGFMPSLSAWSMAPSRLVNQAWAIAERELGAPVNGWLLGGVGLGVLLLYAGAATALTIRIVRQFDRWLDRPPLSVSPEPRPEPTPVLEQAAVS